MTASIARAVAPKGFRLLNPGNIRKGQDWQGLVPANMNPDASFDCFVSAEMGFRALCKILLSYQRKHKLETVKDMISRWAPPSENPTDKYVAFVATSMGVEPEEKIKLDRQKLFLMAKAIARQENGRRPDGSDWFTDAQCLAGVDMALGGS